MSDYDSFMSGIILGILLGSIIFFLIAGLFFISDKFDNINVREMGKKLCATKNLEYSHRTFETEININKIPTIYCKKKETKLIDGVLKYEG